MYSTDYTIRYSECGASQQLKIVNIFHYLQDVADEHALKMGIAAGELRDQGYSWILYRYGIRIHRYPLRGEKITIETWPWMHRNLYEMRAFNVCDEQGQILFEANTCWLMVDIEKGSPVRLNRTPYVDILKGEKKEALELEEIPDLKEPEAEIRFRVRLHDLDTNRHVNNAIYPEWAIETIPKWTESRGLTGSMMQFRPCRIEVNYKSSAFYGDMVLCSTTMISGDSEIPVFVHKIRRASDNAELARLRTTWRSELQS